MFRKVKEYKSAQEICIIPLHTYFNNIFHLQLLHLAIYKKREMLGKYTALGNGKPAFPARRLKADIS